MIFQFYQGTADNAVVCFILWWKYIPAAISPFFNLFGSLNNV